MPKGYPKNGINKGWFIKGISTREKIRIKIICKICGKEFYVIPSRKNIAKYCSDQCRYKSIIGKTPWNKDTKGIMIGFWKGKQRPRGNLSFNWQGGIKKHSAGYILIHYPNHPFADEQGYVFEHRLVAEKALGRYLRPEERVHHINGIKTDNRKENLYVFINNSSHTIFHHLTLNGKRKAPDPISNLSPHPLSSSSLA